MTKLPALTTANQMIELSAKEDMAKATIGATVIQLRREGRGVSWAEIVAILEGNAEGRGIKAGADLLAKGALQFIATLPQNTVE